MASLFEKVDTFIIDSVFQKIVDWGKDSLNITKFSFVAISIFLYGMGHLSIILIEIAENNIPYTNAAVFLLIIWFAPYILRVAKLEDKEGMAPRSRYFPINKFLRLLALLMVVTTSSRLLFKADVAYADFSHLSIGFSIWTYFNFLACRNNPPTFKKAVPQPI